MFDFGLIDDVDGMLKKCGIYKITCTANNKFYIGCTYNSFRARLISHRSELKRSKHYAFYMQNSFNKYGIDSFKIEILEILDRSNPDLIFEKEDYWINLLQPHFNYPPTANSIIHVKSDFDIEEKLHVKNTSGHRNVAVSKDGTYSVKIWGYSLGKYKCLADAVQAKESFLLNPVYREPKPPNRSGEKCIQHHSDGWVVAVKDKYVGFYKTIEEAVIVRDAFLALPPDQQTAKVCQSNTGEKNIMYRQRTDRYRIVFGDDEVASSCKTLQEAIQVRDAFLATGERPPNQKAGSGHKYISFTKAGHFTFSYNKKRIATYHSLEEAVQARDSYIEAQNKLTS